MLKTISAALVAVSVVAAPALAGMPGKTAQAPAAKQQQGNAKLRSANAGIGNPKHHRHHRHHQHIGLNKVHAKHIAVKHVTPSAKRG